MKIKPYLLPIALNLTLISTGYAAPITNKITGVGPQDAPVVPLICIQDGNGANTYSLKPGESTDGNKASGNDYYVGATLRFGGCTPDNTYLGYLGLSVNKTTHTYAIASYSPPKGVHIAFKNASIDSSGNIKGKIEYTPISANYNLNVTPKKNEIWDFVGVNLSGLEFSKILDATVVPNLSEEDASSEQSDLNEIRGFIAAGMNTIRVPVSWGFLQLDGPGKGELNLEYFNSYIKPLLETLTIARVNTIVDLHAYMRYSKFGKDFSGCSDDKTAACPGGTMILDTKAYQDVWLKFYTLIKNDSRIDMNYISLDLMNEPVDVPDDLVFTIQADLIKVLRQAGFQGNILVEGNSWTGLHSWDETTWQSRDGKTTYKNSTLFTRDNFLKAGISDLSKVIINVHQYLDSNYSGTQEICLTDTSTMGTGKFNLEVFTKYLETNKLKAIVTEFGAGRDSASCKIAIENFMQHMRTFSAKDKEFGYVGWTAWSAGHGWGNYNLRITPLSYQMDALRKYL